MSDSPLISVCIPAYNSEAFIASTVESVLHQTYPYFEIVLTDDRSTDGTLSVVRRFSDSRLRVVENETNLGIGRNWNKAMSLAAGKYIKLLCGDDVIYPDCLRRQVEPLENPANAGVVLAVCGSEVIDPAGKVLWRRRSPFRSGRNTGATLVRRCVRRGTNVLGEPATGLFPREALRASLGFDASNPYVLDLAFWAELLKRGDAFIDRERLSGFRISSASVSAKLGLTQAAYFRSFARHLQADPHYRLSRSDVLRGYFFSFQWCILRTLLINLKAGKSSDLD